MPEGPMQSQFMQSHFKQSQQDSLIKEARAGFKRAFESDASLLVQAPGRVNLIGEHTDYNDGFVLPCAINYHTIVAARPRDDSLVNVVALNYESEVDSFDLSEPIAHQSKLAWANYVRGVLQVLQQRTLSFKGADLAILGNIPQGAGVSSSASLELAIGHSVNGLYGLGLSSESLALIGQQAENEFVGCQCGIMDQLVIAKGQAGHCVLIDCRSLDTTAAAIPNGMRVMIVNSNVQRRLVDGEYNMRREQCETAARVLGVKALRDATIESLNAQAGQLSELVFRRARHVITENARTQAAFVALNENNMHTLGGLMRESHASMRDDFEITVSQIDYLVDLINQLVGEQGGARMTGGGFGGCVVALVPDVMVEQVGEEIRKHYQNETGLNATIYVCEASEGAGVI